MTKKNKLTSTQLNVLERMDRGYQLFHSGTGYHWRTSRNEPNWAYFAVRATTVRHLEELGYIEEIIIVKTRTFLWRITDEGRKALRKHQGVMIDA